MDFEKYNDKFLEEYLRFNKPRLVSYRRAKLDRVTDDTTVCPECGAKIETDYLHAETHCTRCGLVTQATIEYVGLRKIIYPYGLLL